MKMYREHLLNYGEIYLIFIQNLILIFDVNQNIDTYQTTKANYSIMKIIAQMLL